MPWDENALDGRGLFLFTYKHTKLVPRVTGSRQTWKVKKYGHLGKLDRSRGPGAQTWSHELDRWDMTVSAKAIS